MLLKISSLWKTSLKKLILFDSQKFKCSKKNLILRQQIIKKALIQNIVFFKKSTIFSNFNNILFYFWESLKNNYLKNFQIKKYSKQSITLQNFEKSNQNTYLFQRPLWKPFQWVQKGDLISDCAASSKGELSLGKNLLVGYMPWEGLNFEDAVLINEKIVSKYTSLHIEKYDLEINENGFEKITRNIPGVNNLRKLDKNGIIKIGSWVTEGDILVGLTIPVAKKTLLTHEKLLYDIVGQKTLKVRERCLRVPQGVSGRIIRIIYTAAGEPQAPGTFIHSCPTPQGGRYPTGTTGYRGRDSHKEWGRVRAKSNGVSTFAGSPRGNEVAKDHSSTAYLRKLDRKSFNQYNSFLKRVTLYIAQKRKFKVGDKISGRHGNKGIISKILSNYDMPYMFNGTTLDVLLNPLGVPSRMNVGQILECLLGFAGQIFNTQFKVLCFDEMYGYEASRSFVYSKLFESCKKTNQQWLFNKKSPGKLHLFDGRNGQSFSQSILIGTTYLMKLIHIVDEKIHVRATGPYSLITQQPLRGRAKHGGQRLGEMEVWALQGFGCAYTLQELLTVKSDDLYGRNQIMQTLLKNTPMHFGTPESLRVVLRELQCLCLDLQLSI
uniref:DNA-directed RNA polymerase n=1 Tax=Udotea flabellum TaxID=170437 RepID=A0A386B1T2_9CHLO|nr:RNA polymerase b-subunit [Udotea flabellum]AYC65633.1 RNA polymerase b-subunit [Udotea flabellum]